MAVRRPGLTTECLHKLRPIDSAVERMPMPSPQPDKGHTVGNYQVGPTKRALKPAIGPRLGNTMHAGNRNVPSSRVALNPGFNPGDNVRNLDGMHGNVQHT